MRYLKITLLMIVLCLSVPSYADNKIEALVPTHYFLPLKTAHSLDALKNIGEILYHNDKWCILRFFIPTEGIGYGSIIIYKKDNAQWHIFKKTSELLLPKVTVNEHKVIIKKQNSLNDKTYSEVYTAIIQGDDIKFITPNNGHTE